MKFRAAAALAATAALVLAGCSSADEPTPSATPDGGSVVDPAILDSFTWTTDVATGNPALEFEAGVTVADSVARFIADGDGEPIRDGDYLILDYTAYNGTSGAIEYSTYEAGAGETLQYDVNYLDPTLYDALKGKKIGAQLVYGFPNVTAPDGSSIFMALTVTSAFEVLERAEGAAVEPVEGLPAVTLDESGAPSVDLAGQEDATELVSQLLIEGTGDPVEVGDEVFVHYSGWLLDGTQFDSSWTRGAPANFILSEGSLIKGWVDGLAGVPVGSQVLLVIPASLGYGETGSASIPGGATLVFVVDVLAAQ